MPGLEIRGELRQLRDRDRLVADPLQVNGAVKHGEDEPEVAGDGGLEGKRLLDELLDPVVARIDLVVERDHLVAELRVLRLERA